MTLYVHKQELTSASRRHPWFSTGLILLGVGLALNSFLGPLFADVVNYPFTETVYSETLGLEAVTLVLVAPLAILAGTLVARSHRAGPLLALAPASYSAYMLVQYIVGPQYSVYHPVIAWHLMLLVLSLGLLIRAWTLAEPGETPIHQKRWATVVVILSAFILSRWLPAFVGMFTGEPVPAEAPDRTMYWSIFLLDLGVVIPAATATVVGLFWDLKWARRALFAVIAWFALVPPSVAAMSVVKLLRDDPVADLGDTILFLVVAVVVITLAVVLYRPVLVRPKEHTHFREQVPGGGHRDGKA